MKLIKKSILLLALAGGTFLSGGKAYAQQALVDVRVDSAAILIGEQTVLHLTVTTDKDKAVQLVIPRDTLMAGVEVLEIPKADSTLIENDRLLIKQDLLVTSFDSSLYLLPPFMVIDGADTVYSNQVALKVSTVPVNADKPEEFYDIKSDNKYSYKHSLGNSTSYTYSERLIDFIINEIKKNPDGFVESLKK